MFMYGVMLTLVAAFMITATLQANNAVPESETRAAAEVINLRQYNQAVSQFVDANPAFSGTVTSANVAPYLPSWYNYITTWNATVVGGTPRIQVVYGVTTLGGGIDELVRSAKGSRLTGYSGPGNTLWSPIHGNTGIALPASVTANSLVIVSYH